MLIIKLLQVCNYLLQFKNFNSLLNIYTAINLRVQQHLPETIEIVRRHTRAHRILRKLEGIFRSDNQFKSSWFQIKRAKPPFIPSFMLCCKRIQTSHAKKEINELFLKDKIDFYSIREIYKVLKMIKSCQEVCYGFYKIPILFQFFETKFYEQLKDFRLNIEIGDKATLISLNMLRRMSVAQK